MLLLPPRLVAVADNLPKVRDEFQILDLFVQLLVCLLIC